MVSKKYEAKSEHGSYFIFKTTSDDASGKALMNRLQCVRIFPLREEWSNTTKQQAMGVVLMLAYIEYGDHGLEILTANVLKKLTPSDGHCVRRCTGSLDSKTKCGGAKDLFWGLPSDSPLWKEHLKPAFLKVWDECSDAFASCIIQAKRYKNRADISTISEHEETILKAKLPGDTPAQRIIVHWHPYQADVVRVARSPGEVQYLTSKQAYLWTFDLARQLPDSTYRQILGQLCDIDAEAVEDEVAAKVHHGEVGSLLLSKTGDIFINLDGSGDLAEAEVVQTFDSSQVCAPKLDSTRCPIKRQLSETDLVDTHAVAKTVAIDDNRCRLLFTYKQDDLNKLCKAQLGPSHKLLRLNY